jgi:hypothetical protein
MSRAFFTPAKCYKTLVLIKNGVCFRVGKAKLLSRVCTDTKGFIFGQNQGCQMVYFQTKNRNLGIFWMVL